jgi:hypothetical protein
VEFLASPRAASSFRKVAVYWQCSRSYFEGFDRFKKNSFCRRGLSSSALIARIASARRAASRQRSQECLLRDPAKKCLPFAGFERVKQGVIQLADMKQGGKWGLSPFPQLRQLELPIHPV